jgi:hypothetical protein
VSERRSPVPRPAAKWLQPKTEEERYASVMSGTACADSGIGLLGNRIFLRI